MFYVTFVVFYMYNDNYTLNVRPAVKDGPAPSCKPLLHPKFTVAHHLLVHCLLQYSYIANEVLA